MTWSIVQHDVQVTPWPLEDESVQCVVTSPPSVIQGFAEQVETVPVSEDGSVHGPFGGTATPTGTRVFLACSQPKHRDSRPLLDAEIWEQLSEDSSRESVRSLPAVERASVVAVGLLAVVVPTERFSEKRDGCFMNHAELDSLMVDRADRVLPLGLLDSDVRLAVYQPGEICEPFVGRHVVTNTTLGR